MTQKEESELEMTTKLMEGETEHTFGIYLLIGQRS